MLEDYTNISTQLDEIIRLMKETTLSDYIAIISLFISIIALIANIITNIKKNKQYIESLKPLLSFDFFEMDDILLLAIKNTGKTEAKNIKIEILKLNNNGEYNELHLDGLFKNRIPMKRAFNRALIFYTHFIRIYETSV